MEDREPTTVFFGRVHPERGNVNITFPPLQMGPTKDNLVQCRLRIEASQLSVQVVGDLNVGLDTWKNYVTTLASTLTDVLGFANACGYTLELSGCAGDLGTQTSGARFPGLTDASADEVSAEFLRISALVANDPDGRFRPLRRALADFRRALLEPDDTPFHCFRAAEALTYYFDQNASRAARVLQAKLNISANWWEARLKRPADEIRHGRVVAVSADDRKGGLLCAREVICRFVEMASRQLDQLPQSEFPKLTL